MPIKKVAIVGLGNISNRHRKNIKQLYPKAIVYAVSASGRLPEETVQDADIVCANISHLPVAEMCMAIVASPATSHASHAIEFIAAGVPTLIEKPLAASIEDSEKILESQKKSKTPVAVGYCLRYLGSTLAVKRLLSEGMIGQVYNVFSEIGQYLPDWRPGQDYKTTVSASKELGGGALLELSHELDYLSWLFGELEPVGAVLRTSNELGLDVEDSADILAKSGNTVLSIHLDFLQKKAHRKCRIVGSNGVLEWDLIKDKILFIAKEESRMLFDGCRVDRNKMYLDMLAEFQRLMAGKSNSCVTVDESLQIVSLIEQVRNMARPN